MLLVISLASGTLSSTVDCISTFLPVSTRYRLGRALGRELSAHWARGADVSNCITLRRSLARAPCPRRSAVGASLPATSRLRRASLAAPRLSRRNAARRSAPTRPPSATCRRSTGQSSAGPHGLRGPIRRRSRAVGDDGGSPVTPMGRSRARRPAARCRSSSSTWATMPAPTGRSRRRSRASSGHAPR